LFTPKLIFDDYHFCDRPIHFIFNNKRLEEETDQQNQMKFMTQKKVTMCILFFTIEN